MPEYQGSDHCPAWVDLELNCPPSTSEPPKISSRFLFAAGERGSGLYLLNRLLLRPSLG